MEVVLPKTFLVVLFIFNYALYKIIQGTKTDRTQLGEINKCATLASL